MGLEVRVLRRERRRGFGGATSTTTFDASSTPTFDASLTTSFGAFSKTAFS